MKIHRVIRGAHQGGPTHAKSGGNQDAIKRRCVPIMVTPDELARTVDQDGVVNYRAVKLVESLINRAHDEAVAQTIGAVA